MASWLVPIMVHAPHLELLHHTHAIALIDLVPPGLTLQQQARAEDALGTNEASAGPYKAKVDDDDPLFPAIKAKAWGKFKQPGPKLPLS